MSNGTAATEAGRAPLVTAEEMVSRITKLEGALRLCQHYIEVSPMPGLAPRREILFVIESALSEDR